MSDIKLAKGRLLAALLDSRIAAITAETGAQRSAVIAELAENAGITANTMRRVLTGEINRPPDERLAAFAATLDMDEAILIDAAEADRATRSKATKSDLLIARSPIAVKRVGDGVFEGPLVKFGTPDATDLEGDFFDSETEFGVQDGTKLPLFYDHGMHPDIGPRKIGQAEIFKTEDSIFLRGEIANSEQYRADIERLIDEGREGLSSGALPWLVDGEQRGKGWYWKQWIIGEGSLTVRPAEPRILVQTAKTFTPSGVNFRKAATDNEPEKSQEEKPMPEEQNGLSAAELFDRFEARAEKMEGDFKDQIKSLKDENDKLRDELDTVKSAPGKPEYDIPALHTSGIKHYKYDHMSPGELALMIGCLDSASRADMPRAQKATQDAYSSLALRLLGDDGKDNVKARSAFLKHAQTRGLTLKADELHQSDLASGGDEWVGVAYSSDFWEEVHQRPTVFPRVPSMEFPDGAESMVIGTKDGSVTFYTVAQAASQSANPGLTTRTVKTSKMTTDNRTLDLAKVGAASSYTGELREDAFIPFVSILRSDMIDEAARTLDQIAIDGDTDTSATTNINDIGGTPNGDEAFLAFNGFRKLPLVTNTANSRDGGTISEADVLETVKLMGAAGEEGLDIEQVKLLMDLNTYWKLLDLTNVKTRDVNSQATIESGVLTQIFGYEVVPSAYMHRSASDRLANSDGKIDQDTTANNTTGAMLAVRMDQWMVGWKRRFTIEAERIPRADATEFTGLLRVGMINRSNEAAAISYNLTV